MANASLTASASYSTGPVKLPPGHLEPVEELPGDSDIDDGNDQSDDLGSISDLDENSNTDGGDNEDDLDIDLDGDGDGEGSSMRERDPVFERIKESLSKTQRSEQRSESALSDLSSASNGSDGPHVQISQHYTSVPYGIQPRATYEHSSQHADIMGVAYNGRMRQFVILDSKGITTWKRDVVDPRDQKDEIASKTLDLNQGGTSDEIKRALQYPKYEYRLFMNIVYAPKHNCYFALGKDFSVKVLNRDFEETCSVNTDMRSVLYILFNPVRDELITGGVGGIKIWQFQQAAGKAFTELKPLANYELRLKETLPNVGGSWVKKVELDYHLQHLYCCSDTDLHVYDLTGKLLYKFQRAHTMSITGVCFSPSAKVLITSSVDSEVKIWSMTGGLVQTFRGHSRAVTGLMLHPETSSIIITSSMDGSIRMWSLDTMDLLYMIVVSADGVLWMGLTDDKLLYISTCRNITLWHLNNFFSFWSTARNQITSLGMASCEEKTTRILAIGEDSSVRIFCRSNKKNITTVLPPPDISPLQKVLSVSYSREKNAAFLLITNKEIWVYTTRTDPASRIAIWNVHDLQLPYISGDVSNLPPGVIIQPPSQNLASHRATENGNGNEIVANCCSVCILNSTAMMWTDEGLCCPIRHTYLLLGMDDGRILFMDPVIKGQKYMDFKASKDAILEMRHDMAHSCLMTMCKLKTLMLIQVWGLPQLDAMYEVFCGPDISGYARVGLSMLTGHTSGHVNMYPLEMVDDQGALKSKLEPPYDSIVDEGRRAEHQAPVVAMDSLASLQIFVTCSSDGAIKVWEENKVLLTEVMLEDPLSAACFLNDMGDLLVAFKNQVFYIDHSKLFPSFKPQEIEMETSDQESDVYEDPRVLYELIRQEDEPVTLQNYLVPYDHLEFDKDFLEGKTRIEQPKTAAEAIESSESETETDISLAPSSIYLSPADSIESLSMIDLTLGADYSKYDLRAQMKATLDHIVTKDKKHGSKLVSIDTSDMEERELDMEMEKFSLPTFGESPGDSPSITPPSGQASPRSREQQGEDMADFSDDDAMKTRPSGFVPIMPDKASSSAMRKGANRPKVPLVQPNSASRLGSQLSEPDSPFDDELDTPDGSVEMGFNRFGSPKKSRGPASENNVHSDQAGPGPFLKKGAFPMDELRDDMSAISEKSEKSSIQSRRVTSTPWVSDSKYGLDFDVSSSDETDTKSIITMATEVTEKESGYHGNIDIDQISDKLSDQLEIKSEADSQSLHSHPHSDFPTATETLSSHVVNGDDLQNLTGHARSRSCSLKSRSTSAKSTRSARSTSSKASKSSGKVSEGQSGNDEDTEVDETGRRVKGGVRGLMKKRRVTSGRAPSLTRKSSTDHTHDDHDHGHDDKRAHKDLKKNERKLPPAGSRDMSKLASLPPNPPSMLSRKRSLTDHRQHPDGSLLNHPDHHGQIENQDPNMAQIHFDDDADADKLQEEQWASEAAIQGQTLTLPPQKGKNKARLTKQQRDRDRKRMLGERGSTVESHIPGVGSSPTAELEQNEEMTDIKQRETTDDGIEKSVDRSDGVQSSIERSAQTDKIDATDLDMNAPETQMQRTHRLGYKLDMDLKVFEDERIDNPDGNPRAVVNRRNRSKLNVYIPQAERESLSSARSSYRGTPDSGLDEATSLKEPKVAKVTQIKLPSDVDEREICDVELRFPDDLQQSENDRQGAAKRPASSFTGLRRGQLEGERLRAERPHTAHVRFKAEDLQEAFQEALERYQNLPGAPPQVSADTLYRNDGLNFEDNWQERVIERHTLLRMQKEIRAQSAAQRRHAIETIQKDKHREKLFTSRCESAMGNNFDTQSIHSVLRANTSMSVPIGIGYGATTAPPPTRDKARPKTANPALEKQQILKSELSQEKSFRYRLSTDTPTVAGKRPSSSKTISTVADFSPHWIDPRNPDAWRPKSSKSIPSKCNRYILVNRTKEKHAKPVPSPLEEQLLFERFPKMGSKLLVNKYTPAVSPAIKKNHNIEYSPFVYQRFV